MSVKISIAYHSGYGHTKKMAEAVLDGVKASKGVEAHIIAVDAITDADWAILDSSDGIIFGCPTYMGSASAKFKEFTEKASGRWMKQVWKDKIAAGFTNSGSLSGDKLNTLFQLAVNAMQHSMIWVGTGMQAPFLKGVEAPGSAELNRVGSYIGVASQSNNEPAEMVPPSGDLETARLFGKRVAEITQQFKKGAN